MEVDFSHYEKSGSRHKFWIQMRTSLTARVVLSYLDTLPVLDLLVLELFTNIKILMFIIVVHQVILKVPAPVVK